MQVLAYWPWYFLPIQRCRIARWILLDTGKLALPKVMIQVRGRTEPVTSGHVRNVFRGDNLTCIILGGAAIAPICCKTRFP